MAGLAVLDWPGQEMGEMKQSRSALRKSKALARSIHREDDNAIGRTIGTRLKSLYDEVASQPIPEKFLDLLDQLAATPVDPDAGRKTS